MHPLYLHLAIGLSFMTIDISIGGDLWMALCSSIEILLIDHVGFGEIFNWENVVEVYVQLDIFGLEDTPEFFRINSKIPIL